MKPGPPECEEEMLTILTSRLFDASDRLHVGCSANSIMTLGETV